MNASKYRRQTILLIAVTGWGLFLTILYGLGLLFPSGANWGIHTLAFYPLPVALIAAALMLLPLSSAIQRSLLVILASAANRVNRLSLVVRIAVIVMHAAMAVVVFYTCRERVPLLGDGMLLGNVITTITDLTRTAVSKVEPLSLLIIIKTWRLLAMLNISTDAFIPYQLVSLLAGLGFLVAGWFLVRLFTDDAAERVLLYVLVVGSGMAQLFFCYIENYSVFALGIMLFLIAALRYAKGLSVLFVPSVVFGILFTLQFGAVCFLPALVYLMVVEWMRGGYRMVLFSLAAMVVTVMVVLGLCGYSFTSFVAQFVGGASNFLPFFSRVGTTYPIVSWRHAIDLLNLVTLIQPFSVILGLLVIVTIAAEWKRLFGSIDHRTAFLLLAGGGAAVLLVAMHFELGMSRDWDAAAPFAWAIAVALLAFVVIQDGLQLGTERSGVLLVISAFTLISTILWVGINADTERMVARIRVLPERTLWDQQAYFCYDDAMYTYYQYNRDYASAAACYRDHLASDSTNMRIWLGLGIMYRKLDDRQNEKHAYEKVIALGGKYPDVYENLSSMYLLEGDITAAGPVTMEGLIAFPQSAQLNNNQGIVLMNRDGDWAGALAYFQTAVHFDGRYSKAYYNAGYCCRQMGDLERMSLYYQQFMMLEPDNPVNAQISSEVAAAHRDSVLN